MIAIVWKKFFEIRKLQLRSGLQIAYTFLSSGVSSYVSTVFSCFLSHTLFELRFQVTSLPCFHVFFRIHFLSYRVKLRLHRKITVFSIFLPHTLFEIRLTSYGTTVTNNRISVFAYNSLIYFTGDRFDGKLNKCQITTLHPSWSGQVDSLEHSST